MTKQYLLPALIILAIISITSLVMNFIILNKLNYTDKAVHDVIGETSKIEDWQNNFRFQQ